MNKNPLFTDYKQPFDTIPFNEIKTENFLPAIHEGIKMSNRSQVLSFKHPKQNN